MLIEINDLPLQVANGINQGEEGLEGEDDGDLNDAQILDIMNGGSGRDLNSNLDLPLDPDSNLQPLNDS